MPKVLITGGGGFVGKALGEALKEKKFEVISVARNNYPELSKVGIEHQCLDLSEDPGKLIEISKSCDAIFHVAAKVDMWGKYQDFYKGNVIATRNVIQACKTNNIPKLIFTSSPSVIADGQDLNYVDESYPYPRKYTAFYPQTKALAEQEVLKSNDGNSFRTIALRPHLIWGKNDTNLIPAILSKASKGKLICVGKGENLTDLTYINDCVRAHILAYEALEKNPECYGKAYFISQGDPVKMWEWIDQILEIHKLPKVKRKINKKLATGIATALEFICRVIPGNPEPMLTRFLVCEMSTSHYFNISAAAQDIGYRPSYTIKQALEDCFNES